MAFPQGITFRQTSGFVTDPTNYNVETAQATVTYPRTTPQGNTVGWESGAGNVATRDRSSSLDPRIAGLAFTFSITAVYRIDLPSSGTYNIGLGAGDLVGEDVNIDLFDTTTSLGSLSSGTIGANTYNDATNTNYSAAAWPGSQTLVSKSFATTICRFKLDPSASGTINVITSVFIQAGSGVTVALTGQRSTFASGILAPANALALTGQQATFGAGQVVPGLSLALLGKAGTFTSGLLAPSISIALLGQAATFATGTITASSGGNVTVSLTGQASAFTAGILAPSNSVALSGAQAMFSQGNVAPGTAASASGQRATFSPGTMLAAVSVSLNGQQALFTPGNLLVPGDVTVALTGTRAIFTAGFLIPSVPGGVQVPNVVGMDWYSASHVLITMSLNQTVIPVQVASNLPDGQVLSQDPPAGSNVDPHTNVVLRVSVGYLLSASFDVIPIFS